MKKSFLALLLAIMFVFSPFYIHADDDDDGWTNDDWGDWSVYDDDDYEDDDDDDDSGSYPDFANFTDEDWDNYFAERQEDPDGWDGTPATYGQEANSWWDDIDWGDENTVDWETHTLVSDVDGNLVVISVDDVYDDDGNFIYTYDGVYSDDPDFKADVENRIAEFFEDMVNKTASESLSELLSRYVEALKELDEAKIAGDNVTKIEELESILASLREELDEICAKTGYQWSVSEKSNFGVITNREGKTVYHAGDPVIFASGDFIIDDSDIRVRGKQTSFEITRHYSSLEASRDEVKGGIFGSGWASNLETRIIGAYSSDFIDSLPAWENYMEELKSHESKMSEYLDEDSETSDLYASMQEILAAAESEYSLVKDYVERSQTQRNLNRAVDYGYAAKLAQRAGLGIVFYCQDNGGLLVFEKQEDGSYSLNPAFKNAHVSLSVFDNLYCISYLLTCEKRFYSMEGLPLYFTFKNGGRVDFSYDAQSRLDSISLDGTKSLAFEWNGTNLLSVKDCLTSRRVAYAYEDGFLSSVCDWEGDTKRFSYSGGMLASQIKADNSCVCFEYEEIDGKKRTVRTRNEEGFYESFYYNIPEKTTVYSDHDGVTSVFVYDERGRTVREERADSYFAYYEYDADGNLLSKTDNSGKTEFLYDSACNLCQKIYPDTSREIWSYNDSSLSSYTDRDGIVQNYLYDADGLMTDLFRGSELLFHFDYNEDGLLVSQRDCCGNELRFTYDSRSNITKRALFAPGAFLASKTEKFEYDSQNRIASFTDALARKTTYSYSPHKIMSSRSDGLDIIEEYSNRKLLLSRTESDRITGETRTYSYEYDGNKNCVAVFISGIDSMGKKVEKSRINSFEYTQAGRAKRVVFHDFLSSNQNFASEFEYGNGGKLSSERTGLYDEINGCFSGSVALTEYSGFYGEKGWISSIKRSDGSVFEQSFDLNGRCIFERVNGKTVMENLYSPAGRLIEKSSGFGGFYEYDYDSVSGLCSYKGEKQGLFSDAAEKKSYFPDGRLKSVMYGSGRKTEYFYDEFKNPVKITSVSGSKIRSYDRAGRILSEKILDLSGKLVSEDEWLYSERKILHIRGGKYKEAFIVNAFNEVISYIDGNGNEKKFFRDVLGRVICEKDAYGSELRKKWNAKNLVSKIEFPDGSFLSYSYDENSNCCECYDGEGLLWQKSYDSDGKVKSCAERPFFVLEQYEYDERGSLVSVSRNGVLLKKAVYDDKKKTCVLTDALGNSNYYEHDSFSRLLRHKNSLSSVQEFSYGSDGLLKAESDFKGNSRKISYGKDLLSCRIDFSDGESFSYLYDASSNLTRASSNDLELCFSYDGAGFLCAQCNSDGKDKLSFDYDEAGNLVKIRSEQRTISYAWGKNRELLEVSDCVFESGSKVTCSVRFAYDKCGREILRVYDSGESIKSLYDKNGRLILKTGYSSDLQPVFVDGAVYDERGAKIFSLNSDLSVTAYSYDTFGRLSLVSYPYSDSLAKKMKYECADAGLHYLSGNEKISELSFSADEYEKLRFLCSQIGLGNYQVKPYQCVLFESFDYDLNNNLKSKTNPYNTIRYSYDSENRLVSWGNGASASYDKNGNMIEKKSCFTQASYEYSPFNRLKKISSHSFLDDSDCVHLYDYDALFRRSDTSSSESGSYRNMYIALSPKIFSSSRRALFSDELASSKNTRSGLSKSNANHSGRYVFIDDMIEEDGFYEVKKSSDEPFATHPLYDERGMLLSYISSGSSRGEFNSVLMTDEAGSVRSELSFSSLLNQYEYDVFGTPLADFGHFAFAGKSFDKEAGIYDFGYRDYEPELARFSSVDPARDGVNWYAYCQGNPVTFYDRDGLYSLPMNPQEMQDMGDALLGDSKYDFKYSNSGLVLSDKTEYAASYGCLVTALAEALTALTGTCVTNDYVNSLKDCFNGGNVSWKGVDDAFGLSRENVFTAKADVTEAKNFVNGMLTIAHDSAYSPGGKFGELFHCAPKADDARKSLTAMEDLSNITHVLSAIEKSSGASAVIAQVCYDRSGKTGGNLHFVGIGTQIHEINGKQVVSVTATSMYDKAENFGGVRRESGWILHEGKVYIPLTLINRIDTLSKAR
ncbi:RHS repeat-associated core domain-containing protein [uncultured Treponema sp.]|uniref:RHS repeat-associated core domain-containing protein n=1 Tax=uncultured Treponema sp. TaxID=162155 RepID=UPI0025DF309D|nr:RHS repeat-associated core domain-containing protein [uncultured Treponema sp.]